MITNGIIVLAASQQIIGICKRWVYYNYGSPSFHPEDHSVAVALFESWGQVCAFIMTGLLFDRVILTILRYDKCQTAIRQLIDKQTALSMQSNFSHSAMTEMPEIAEEQNEEKIMSLEMSISRSHLI